MPSYLNNVLQLNIIKYYQKDMLARMTNPLYSTISIEAQPLPFTQVLDIQLVEYSIAAC